MEEPNTPPPYAGAEKWNALLHGRVGAVLSFYARYKQVQGWDFPDEMLSVAPSEFLDFCKEANFELPPDLLCAAEPEKKLRSTPAPDLSQEQVYRAVILEVARDLTLRPGWSTARMSVVQLEDLVESRLANSIPRVDQRAFERYLEKMRTECDAEALLARLLRRAKGNQSATEKRELASRLTPEERKTLCLSTLLPR